MTGLPADRDAEEDSNPETGVSRSRGPATGTPRWVKVFGIIVIALTLVFVIIHLAGGGMGGHTP